VALQVEPALRVRAEECRQAQGRIGRDAAQPVDDFVDPTGGTLIALASAY